MDTPRKRPRRRLWKLLLLLPLLGLCAGSLSLGVMADQTTFLGVAYLQSVHSGNLGLAGLMGDHFSDDKDWNQRFFDQDIQRDTASFQNVELSDVSSTIEESLSGQSYTMVRYKWRPKGSTDPWSDGALRVKTDHWWIFTYIRAVEPTSQ